MADEQRPDPDDLDDLDDLDEHEPITPDVAVVREHLIVHLGSPYEVSQLRSNPVAGSPIDLLEVAYFAPGGIQAPVLFASCGMSQSLMENGRRIEILFMMRPAPRDASAIYDLIGALALYPDENQVAIDVGDVIPGGDHLSKICPMDALLAVPPVQFVEGFQRVSRWDQQIVDFLWLVPVFDDEAQYALEHGAESLLMLFAAQGLDLTDLKRDEANTVMTPDDAETMARQREQEEAKKPKRATPVASQPMPQRRSHAEPKSFEVQEGAGDTVVVRRRRTKAPPDAATVVDRPVQEKAEAEPTPPPRTETRPGGPKRFEVPKKERPKKAAPRPKPTPEPTPEERAESKRKRIEALKADAKARAARAKQSREDD